MITIKTLKEYGCLVEEGLQRCMNNADFYLMLVNKALKDEQIADLKNAVKSGDLQKGFEVAHAMKGTYGNLSLTPLYNAVCDITELLRNKVAIDYEPLLENIEKHYHNIKNL